jgi:hypothetical protein
VQAGIKKMSQIVQFALQVVAKKNDKLEAC